MFDLGYSELLLIAVVALIVIGPKDLPKALRVVGQWAGKGRAMARHMRSGFDEMMRQSELEEMEKQWRDHNANIMAQEPHAPDPMRHNPAPPAPEPPVADTPPEPAAQPAAPQPATPQVP